MMWAKHTAIGRNLITAAALVGLLGSALDAGGSGPSTPSAGTSATSLVVTNSGDNGEGSLRQVILEAEARPGPDTIKFDPAVFYDPQTIRIESALPDVTGELTIDGYIENALWKASGAIVNGAGQFPVLRVGAKASLTLRHLTISNGCGQDGGAIFNLGNLVVRGVTFLDNGASREGGAITNLGGTVTVINSTFSGNYAAGHGGALANFFGWATVTNCTFSGNWADRGGAVYNDGLLLLRNSVLANSQEGGDCVSEQDLDKASTRNLIEESRGCGTAIISDDPNLEPLGYYNGPTKTFPIGGGSPAINLGDNAAALDEDGAPLVWDQRGNGDPRFVAGFTDLGAFEHQRHPYLVVDTPEDTPMRACTQSSAADCPLRGAIEIANTRPEPDVITFDPRVFAESRTLLLTRPLPEVKSPLTLDAAGTGGVTLAANGDFTVLTASPGTALELVNVVVEGDSLVRAEH